MSRRLHLLANSKSGNGRGAKLADVVKKVCAEMGATVVVYDIDSPEDLEARAREAVAIAKGSPNDVVVAAGGDGTLRSVAEVVRGSGAIFGVIPVGTFNFFARTHLVPEDHEEAVRLLINGQPRNIRLGEVNGRTFLINASLGLYAKSIQEREESTARFGRNRFVAIASTFKTLLGRHRLLHVRLTTDKGERELKTPMIFIGNIALQLRNLDMKVADCFIQHKLAVVLLKPVRGLEMVRVLARGISKTLEKEKRILQFCTEKLTIVSKRSHHSVALDGEMFEMKSPFEVSSDHKAVLMIAPPPVAGEPA